MGRFVFFAEQKGGVRSPNPYKVNDYVFAGRLIWNTPVEGLRLSTSIHQIKDASTVVRDISNKDVPGLKVNYYYDMYRSVFFSIEYTRGNTVIACEMRDETQIESIPMKFVHQHKFGGREMYLQVDHRWNSWFATALGYGVMWHNKKEFFKFHTDDFSGHTDTYLSARFDFTRWWFLTAQISRYHGVPLYTNQNFDKFGNRNTRDPSWMFMMKTTVYF